MARSLAVLWFAASGLVLGVALTAIALGPAGPEIAATIDAGTDGPASMLAADPDTRMVLAVECGPGFDQVPCELGGRAR